MILSCQMSHVFHGIRYICHSAARCDALIRLPWATFPSARILPPNDSSLFFVVAGFLSLFDFRYLGSKINLCVCTIEIEAFQLAEISRETSVGVRSSLFILEQYQNIHLLILNTTCPLTLLIFCEISITVL